MYQVTLHKKFSNLEFLSEDLDEDDYEAMSFSYSVKRVIRLNFIPQIGSSITIDKVRTTVQDLDFNVNDQSMSIVQYYDVSVENVAVDMIKKLTNQGWVRY